MVVEQELADGREEREDDGPETDVTTDPTRVRGLVRARAVVWARGCPFIMLRLILAISGGLEGKCRCDVPHVG